MRQTLAEAGLKIDEIDGVAYTAGTFFYMRPRLRWSHAIWHGFVIAGSVCHYVAVMLHLL